MIVYLCFSFIMGVLTLFSLSERRELKYLVFLASFLLVLFIGLRDGVGPDYFEYQDVYNLGSPHSFEPLFSVIFDGFSSLGLPFYVFNLFLVVFTISLFLLVSKKFFRGSEITLFLISTVLILFLAFTSTIRQACTLPFIMYALIRINHPVRFLFSVIIGSLFHYSALFLLVCYPFVKFSQSEIFSKRNVIVVVALTIFISSFTSPVILFLDLLSSVSGGFSAFNKITMYLQGYEKQFSLVSIAYRLFFFIFFLYYFDLIKRNLIAIFSFFVYFVLFLMFIVFKDNAVFVNRFALSYNLLIPLLCVYIFRGCQPGIPRLVIFCVLVGFSLVTFLRLAAVQLRYGIEPAFLPYDWVLF